MLPTRLNAAQREAALKWDSSVRCCACVGLAHVLRLSCAQVIALMSAFFFLLVTFMNAPTIAVERNGRTSISCLFASLVRCQTITNSCISAHYSPLPPWSPLLADLSYLLPVNLLCTHPSSADLHTAINKSSFRNSTSLLNRCLFTFSSFILCWNPTSDQ